MMLKLFAFVSLTLASINGDSHNLQYTTVSYSKTGKPCINDCVNQKCVIDIDLKEESCEKSEEPAPIFYIVGRETYYPKICLSNCAMAQTSDQYSRCFIYNNATWDYCTPVQMKSQNYTIAENMNADSCAIRYNDMCLDEQNNVQELSPNVDFGYRVNGDKCKAMCIEKSEGGPTYCNSGYYCAPPAKPPALKEFFKTVPVSHCASDVRNQKFYTVVTAEEKFIPKLSSEIQNSNYFPNLHFKDTRNPVITSTVQTSTGEEPVLPVVVKAKITADTLKPLKKCAKAMPPIVTRNIERMLVLPYDEPTALIGHPIGGVSAMWNVVPLSPPTAETLREYEMDIYNWVNEEECEQHYTDIEGFDHQQGNGTLMNSVDVTILVIYGESTRPIALGVDIVYYKGDKATSNKSEILCNVDQKQEIYTRKLVKRLAGKQNVYDV